MTLQVAGPTQRYEITLQVCPAIGKRNNVMDFFCQSYFTFCKAILTEWMLPYISITDLLPRSSILLLIAGSLVFVIETLSLLLMLGAILFPRLSKVGTFCHSAGTSWTIWHLNWPHNNA